MSTSDYPRADIVVLTALPEEFAAVYKCLVKPTFVVPSEGQPNVYSWHLGTIHSSVHDKPFIVIVGKGEATTTYGALGTKTAIELFKPRYVVFVGCAGGFGEGGQGHGDVAVSNNVYGYEYGKIDRGFAPRPHYHYRVDRGLVRAAEVAAKLDPEWWRPDDTGMTRPPVALVGDIASGDKIVDDPTDPVFAQVRATWPKLLAVEMEAAGVAAAIEEAMAAGKVVGCLVVRGISDMPHAKMQSEGASTAERDTWKVTACTNAARFFAALVARWWPAPPSGSTDPDDADWKRVSSATKSSLQSVRESLGYGIRLDRDALTAQLETALAASGAVALLGPSGSGKSVLVRRAIEGRLATGRAICVDCRIFERQDFAQFEQSLRLSKTLRELAESTADPYALVALDGLDHLRDKRAYQQLTALLAALGVAAPERKWRLLLTCQTQEWSRIQLELVRAGAGIQQWKIVECELPSYDELSAVWREAPKMRRLQFQQRFRPLLGNLKILDLIVSNVIVGRDPPASTWVGESSVALWFWENEIAASDDAAPRIKFISTLAEREATLFGKPPLVTDFEVSELQSMTNLARDRICRRSERDEVVFEHDLLGDWVRFRAVLTSDSQLTEFLKPRLDYPMWHRAVRLYGLYLLEHVGSTARWLDVVAAVSGAHGGSAGDLLLEALFFAGDSLRLFREVKEALVDSDGVLLRRLLNRCASFATVPDPRMMALARKKGIDEVEIASAFRIPSWMFWPPILRFLHEEKKTLIPLAPKEISTLVRLWLEHAPLGSALRDEAASLALMLGERARELRDQYGADDRDARREYYCVALTAAANLPDEVAEFALLEACRAEASADEGTELPGAEQKGGAEAGEEQQGEAEANQTEPTEGGLAYQPIGWDGLITPEPEDEDFGDDELPEDGPRRRVDDEFRAAVLTPSAFRELLEVRPSVAREVALGVLIRERRERRYDLFGNDPFENDLGLENPHDWGIDLYHHGPFLALLRRDFSEGLRLCTGVVDFATRCWRVRARSRRRRRESYGEDGLGLFAADEGSDFLLEVGLEDPYVFEGGPRVFGWSAGLAAAPTLATVALMALEQHFYQRLDEKAVVNELLESVMSNVRSVAFLKVLIDVGKRHPVLFDGPLRPLLACVHLYGWDIATEREGRGHLMIGADREVAEVVSLAQRFHDMPHRKLDLRWVARSRVFASKNMRDYLAQATARWKADASGDEGFADFVEQMDALLDGNPESYALREEAGGGYVLVNKRLEARHEATAPQRQAIADRISMMSLPAQASQLLERNAPLSDDECEALWKEVLRIANMHAPEDSLWGTRPIMVPEPEGGPSAVSVSPARKHGAAFRRLVGKALLLVARVFSRGAETDGSTSEMPSSGGLRLSGHQADGVVGGIAAIACLNCRWLMSDARRAVWSQACIVAAAAAIGPRGPMDSDHTPVVLAAEGFVAVALPCMWANAQSDRELRRLLVDLVFVRRYSTVQAMFGRLALIRASCRRTFQQLRRVALEWAYLRDLMSYVEHIRSYSAASNSVETDRFLEAVSGWQQRTRDAFVADLTPVTVGAWESLNPRAANPEFQRWDDYASQRHHRLALDIQLLHASHAWVPRQENLLDEAERRDMLEFWREGLALVIEPLLSADDEDRVGIPHDCGRWILRGAAAAALSVPLDDAAAYWGPLLSLPEVGHYWCEIFLSEVFRQGLAQSRTPDNLVALSERMLSAAVDGSGTEWFWGDNVWLALLGIDDLTLMSWERRHEPVVRAMIPNIVRWVSRANLYARHVAQLAAWLQRIGGSEARTRLIPALRDVCLRTRRTPLDEESVPKALASLLAEIWRSDGAELRDEALIAFRELLRALADRQDKVALELLGQLGKLT